MGNVLIKFGFNVQSQTEVKLSPETEIHHGCQANILKVTLLQINWLLPIYTVNLLLKFGQDSQSQTEGRIQILKNPIWPPSSHFETDIAENHIHK